MSQIEQFKREIKQNMHALGGALDDQYLLHERLANNTKALGAIGNRLKALNACFQRIDPLQREEPEEKRSLTKSRSVITNRLLYPLLAIKPKRSGGWGHRRH